MPVEQLVELLDQHGLGFLVVVLAHLAQRLGIGDDDQLLDPARSTALLSQLGTAPA